jgi:O-antigen/teichoic acid export membrane protein
MKTTLIRSLTWSSLLIGVPALVLIFTAPWFLKLWLGASMSPGLSLTVGLAFWAVVSNIGFALGNVLWSMNMLKYDLLLTAGMTFLAIGLKVWLTRLFGVPGVVWGLVIAYTVACLPSLWFIPRLFRLLEAGKPPAQDVLWIGR